MQIKRQSYQERSLRKSFSFELQNPNERERYRARVRHSKSNRSGTSAELECLKEESSSESGSSLSHSVPSAENDGQPSDDESQEFLHKVTQIWQYLTRNHLDLMIRTDNPDFIDLITERIKKQEQPLMILKQQNIYQISLQIPSIREMTPQEFEKQEEFNGLFVRYNPYNKEKTSTLVIENMMEYDGDDGDEGSDQWFSENIIKMKQYQTRQRKFRVNYNEQLLCKIDYVYGNPTQHQLEWIICQTQGQGYWIQVYPKNLNQMDPEKRLRYKQYGTNDVNFLDYDAFIQLMKVYHRQHKTNGKRGVLDIDIKRKGTCANCCCLVYQRKYFLYVRLGRRYKEKMNNKNSTEMSEIDKITVMVNLLTLITFENKMMSFIDLVFDLIFIYKMYQIRLLCNGNKIVFLLSVIWTFVGYQTQLSVLIKILDSNNFFSNHRIIKQGKCMYCLSFIKRTLVIFPSGIFFIVLEDLHALLLSILNMIQFAMIQISCLKSVNRCLKYLCDWFISIQPYSYFLQLKDTQIKNLKSQKANMQLYYENLTEVIVKVLVVKGVIKTVIPTEDESYFDQNIVILTGLSSFLYMVQQFAYNYYMSVYHNANFWEYSTHSLAAKCNYIPYIDTLKNISRVKEFQNILNYGKLGDFHFTDRLVEIFSKELVQIDQMFNERAKSQVDISVINQMQIGINIGNSLEYCSLKTIYNFQKNIQETKFFFLITPFGGVDYEKCIKQMKKQPQFKEITSNYQKFLQSQDCNDPAFMELEYQKMIKAIEPTKKSKKLLKAIKDEKAKLESIRTTPTKSSLDHELDIIYEARQNNQSQLLQMKAKSEFYDYLVNKISIKRTLTYQHTKCMMRVFFYLSEVVAFYDLYTDFQIFYLLFYYSEHTAWASITFYTMLCGTFMCFQVFIHYQIADRSQKQRSNQWSERVKFLSMFIAPIIFSELILIDILYTVLVVVFVPIIVVISYIKEKEYDHKIILDAAYEKIFNLNGVNIEGIRRLRLVSQFFFENIPQIILQIRILIWYRVNQAHLAEQKTISVSWEFLLQSVIASTVNGLCQLTMLYLESNAGKTPFYDYIVLCFTGQIEYVPVFDHIDVYKLDEYIKQGVQDGNPLIKKDHNQPQIFIDYHRKEPRARCKTRFFDFEFKMNFQLTDIQIQAIIVKILSIPRVDSHKISIDFGCTIAKISGQRLVDLLIESRWHATIYLTNFNIIDHKEMFPEFENFIHSKNSPQIIEDCLKNQQRTLLQIVGDYISYIQSKEDFIKDEGINSNFVKSMRILEDVINLNDNIFKTLMILDDDKGQEKYVRDYVKHNLQVTKIIKIDKECERKLFEHFNSDMLVQRICFLLPYDELDEKNQEKLGSINFNDYNDKKYSKQHREEACEMRESTMSRLRRTTHKKFSVGTAAETLHPQIELPRQDQKELNKQHKFYSDPESVLTDFMNDISFRQNLSKKENLNIQHQILDHLRPDATQGKFQPIFEQDLKQFLDVGRNKEIDPTLEQLPVTNELRMRTYENGQPMIHFQFISLNKSSSNELGENRDTSAINSSLASLESQSPAYLMRILSIDKKDCNLSLNPLLNDFYDLGLLGKYVHYYDPAHPEFPNKIMIHKDYKQENKMNVHVRKVEGKDDVYVIQLRGRELYMSRCEENDTQIQFRDGQSTAIQWHIPNFQENVFPLDEVDDLFKDIDVTQFQQ